MSGASCGIDAVEQQTTQTLRAISADNANGSETASVREAVRVSGMVAVSEQASSTASASRNWPISALFRGIGNHAFYDN
jgi:hypothetical protein